MKCGAPAETWPITLHQNIGLIAAHQRSVFEGQICKPCVHKEYWKTKVRREFTGLVEHEYGEGVSPGEWKANWETARAEATGDPPSLPSAYTPALYAKAPYFKIVKTLISDAQPRPVNPDYLTVSRDLQVMLGQVFAQRAALSRRSP